MIRERQLKGWKSRKAIQNLIAATAGGVPID
jgi:hypothetical protein